MSLAITIPYRKLSIEDFSKDERWLHIAALEAMERSHAPYSNFTVACTVLFANGELVTGNNQENAAYPSGLCAERVALFKGKSDGLGAIESMLVIAKNDKGIFCESYPCGGCRQVMMEYATQQEKPIRILMQADKSSFFVIDDIRLLLPFGFTNSVL